jgi:hypothetical protein
MYVIFNLDHGCFVNRPGSACSFTPALQMARVFATRELAEKEHCPGNEVVQDVNDIMGD